MTTSLAHRGAGRGTCGLPTKARALCAEAGFATLRPLPLENPFKVPTTSDRNRVRLPAVREIAPGLWHWTARHDQIDMDVSSYFLLPERVLIDAMVPAEGLEWFDKHGAPEHVLLTNRHHDRHAWRFRDEFGCTVHCIRNGLHELKGRGPVEAFDFNEQLPGGAIPFEIGAICPDETALHLPAHRALACADGIVRWPGQDELTFVPDHFMDDPEQTKAGLRNAYRRLLDLDFDLLLLAHGDPVLTGSKEALRAFADSRP